MKTKIIQNDSYTPALLQYEIKTYLRMTQAELAEMLQLSPAAISRAVRNDPALKELRKQIITLINDKKDLLRAS